MWSFLSYMNSISTKSRRIHATSSDTSMFQQALQDLNISLRSEQFDTDSYLDGVIEKPWGHEYRIYSDNFYDVWKLCIMPGYAPLCIAIREKGPLCCASREQGVCGFPVRYTPLRQEISCSLAREYSIRQRTLVPLTWILSKWNCRA